MSETVENPSGFETFALQADSWTSKIAKKMGVEPARFINWRWQMAKQLRTAEDFSQLIDLSPDELAGFQKMGHLFNVGVTPYYAGLLADLGGPLRKQVIPNILELSNQIGEVDPLREKEHSPVPEVVHLYPDRVAFCVAMLCPVYCRYCYRKRRDSEEGLHFNRRIIEDGIAYIASNPKIRDVLVTGGDPLIASNEALEELLSRLRAIPHIEILRIGTRTPVTLPYRIDIPLAKMLARFHPLYVNTHFNCAEELTPEAKKAIAHLVDHGIVVGNQSVLLHGVNDSAERMLALCRAMLVARLRPYYVFHPHRILGSDHLQVSLSRGMQIMKSLRGKIAGFGIPTYILDTPSGKVPIVHNHILGRDGDDLLVEDVHGAIWREPGAYAGELIH